MKHIKFSDLDKLNDNDKLLVCRIAIQNAKTMICLRQGLGQEKDQKKLSILCKAERELMKADDDKGRAVYGIEMTVKDIKTAFNPKEMPINSLSLPNNKHNAKKIEKTLS